MAKIELQTNQGSIHIQLFTEHAPKTTENFIGLVEKGYYDGIIFHRVIPQFMIQGGDPTGTGMGGESIWGKPFEDECTPELRFSKEISSGANCPASFSRETINRQVWEMYRELMSGKK